MTAVRAALEAQIQSGDVVTVVNSWLRMPTIEYVDAYMAFLAELAVMIRGRGGTLLLIGDTPRLRAHAGGNQRVDGTGCLEPATFHKCATPRESAWRLSWDSFDPSHPSVLYAWSLRATIEARMYQLAASPGVKYIPSSWMFDHLCDANVCGPTIPGTNTVMFYGDHHLSTAGAMYLAPFFNCEFASMRLL